MWLAVIRRVTEIDIAEDVVIPVPERIKELTDAEQYLFDNKYLHDGKIGRVKSAYLYRVAEQRPIDLATVYNTCQLRQEDARRERQQQEEFEMCRKLQEKYGGSTHLNEEKALCQTTSLSNPPNKSKESDEAANLPPTP